MTEKDLRRDPGDGKLRLWGGGGRPPSMDRGRGLGEEGPQRPQARRPPVPHLLLHPAVPGGAPQPWEVGHGRLVHRFTPICYVLSTHRIHLRRCEAKEV